MIKTDIILCQCHRQPVNTKVVKGKPFEQKKCFCSVTGLQLFNNFIHSKVKVNLDDDTRDGSEIQCPEDLEKAYEDYDYKKKQGKDD